MAVTKAKKTKTPLVADKSPVSTKKAKITTPGTSPESLKSPVAGGKKFAGAKKSPAGKKFGGKPGLKKKVSSGGGSNKTLPKETAKTRKERKLARKQKKPRFELTQQCKKIWEKLRMHKGEMSKSQSSQLVDQLLKLVKDKDNKLIELVYAHDTSRIIQTCLKQGNEAQRGAIFGELKEKVVEMSKNKYAKNILWKMIKYGTSAQRDEVMQSFRGHVSSVMRKSVFGASVIEFAYNTYANVKQRHMLLREMYGKVYMIHPNSDKQSFGEVLATIESDEEKLSMMTSFHQSLLPLVEKGVMKHTIIHKCFYEYFLHCSDPKLRSDMIISIRESLVHLMHTHDGAHVTLRCLWFGGKKDRKVILKTMKEFAARLATEEFGHLTLLAAFDVVDDTVYMKKTLLAPIMNKLDELYSGDGDDDESFTYVRKVLAYIFQPRSTSHFLPATIKLLQQGDDNKASLKPREQRNNEIFNLCAPACGKFISAHINKMAFNKHNFQLPIMFMSRLNDFNTVDTNTACQSVAKAVGELAACNEFVAGIEKDGHLHLAEDPAGHLMLKKIIINESKAAEAGKENVGVFSKTLLEEVGGEKLSSWSSCNRGASILLALAESKIDEVTKLCKQVLDKQVIEQHASNVKLAQILLTKLQ